MAFLVADGHGGPEAATFCSNELFECLAKYAEGASSKALAAAATKAFSEVHQRVVEETSNAGTTATLVMINETRGELTCASVGDSFAMLMSAPPESITESRPDAPPPPPEQISCNDRLDDNKAERDRVIAQGGRLRRSTNSRGEERGPLRAWPGGVACAKALGDADCGDYLCAVPEIKLTTFPPKGGKIVIASDGVWDQIPFATAANICSTISDPKKAAKTIARAAMLANGGSLTDDVTCIVIYGGSIDDESNHGRRRAAKEARSSSLGQTDLLSDDSRSSGNSGNSSLSNSFTNGRRASRSSSPTGGRHRRYSGEGHTGLLSTIFQKLMGGTPTPSPSASPKGSPKTRRSGGRMTPSVV